MSLPGTPDRPLCVAIIGSGPSGFYAAEALLKAPGLTVRVDLYDRLPTPFGLVRGGVAPDHQKIKSVVVVYEKVATDPRVRFFGNVLLGRDITVEELRARYDQVVYAVGCESDRKMSIPGEDLQGSFSATEFVGWYNGHPDHRNKKFDLSCESVSVVGIGNVAMDVTRILACDPERLAKTDIADYALEALRKSKVKTVWTLGRRGPAEAAYSPVEIEEFGKLEGCDLVIKPEEAVVGKVSHLENGDANDKKKVAYVQEHAKLGDGTQSRKIRLRFCVSPVEVIGEGGKVKAVKLEKNKLVDNGRGGAKCVGIGEFETIPSGMIFRSVGYRGVPITGVAFDEKSGHIPNESGRVVSGGAALPGEYVVGWAKRGPSGLIGTNRADSVLTVQSMLEDLKAGRLSVGPVDFSPESASKLLASRGVNPVSYAQWKKLDELERSRGAVNGKIREKFTKVEDMVAALSVPA
ncbi:MAG: NADP oxidoreductase [Elusimicrobia bacterium CG11_big_fil_rev_8_21_14_0_20_64_6]|nr:MAG: NADP oxidoreductase [Elusimicrobia bacterium CG11_big_fil_rev_8_21_14_0_20_64_6]